MISHYFQKVILFSTWLVVNTALIVTSILYAQYWYIFLIPLSLSSSFNCVSVLLIFVYGIKGYFFNKEHEVTDVKNFVYLVPCYNETESELKGTIDSLKNQENVKIHNKLLMIICDGRVKGPGSESTTDNILKGMLENNTTRTFNFADAYTTWTGEKNNIELIYGYTDNLPFMCLIKDNNVGKRDGLVLLRSLLYNFSNNISNNCLSPEFENALKTCFEMFSFNKFDYIVGTDADTVFHPMCTYKLLNKIESDPNTHGVVGFVHVSPVVQKWNLWSIYQHTEYIIAQCLRRVQQSIVTNKVSCLSGCVQILRVSEETCGKKILEAFNSLPKKDDNVWRHILSFASEDRNHVCLMLSMYPHVKTRQCLDAYAYTIVPMNIQVFRSQRRRWSLGATGNDILLCYKSGINFYERLGAITNVITYFLSLFVFVSTMFFYYAIIVHPTMVMLYLSTIIFVPILYEMCIVLWFPFENKVDMLRFFIGLIIYMFFGAIINICICIYSLLNVDCFKWGKTRKSVEEPSTEVANTTEVNN